MTGWKSCLKNIRLSNFFLGRFREREERRVGNCNALLWLLFFPQVPQPIAMKEITVAMQNKTKPDIRMSSKKTPKRALHAISLELQHIYFPWQNCQGPSHLPLIITYVYLLIGATMITLLHLELVGDKISKNFGCLHLYVYFTWQI